MTRPRWVSRAEDAHPGKVEAAILGERSCEDVVSDFIPQIATEEPVVVCSERKSQQRHTSDKTLASCSMAILQPALAERLQRRPSIAWKEFNDGLHCTPSMPLSPEHKEGISTHFLGSRRGSGPPRSPPQPFLGRPSSSPPVRLRHHQMRQC